MATDEFTNYYKDLLDGSYDCVDRFVLNANFGLCYSPGGVPGRDGCTTVRMRNWTILT
jgi:hypothetical protein